MVLFAHVETRRGVVARASDGAGAGRRGAQIARRHGVRAESLKWWRWEFARRAREASPRLLPVVVAPAPAEPRSEPGGRDIEVVVESGAVRLSVRGALSAEHLAVLVGAVARTC
jgi:transposase-like protein